MTGEGEDTDASLPAKENRYVTCLHLCGHVNVPWLYRRDNE